MRRAHQYISIHTPEHSPHARACVENAHPSLRSTRRNPAPKVASSSLGQTTTRFPPHGCVAHHHRSTQPATQTQTTTPALRTTVSTRALESPHTPMRCPIRFSTGHALSISTLVG